MLTSLYGNMPRSGSAPYAVLFLHAFPLSAWMWSTQIEAFGICGYHVIAPNAYGIEKSPEKHGWTFTDYAHDVAALLDAMQVEKVTVVGLSMGGYQAFEFYRLYPEKVVSLVLCDTRAEADSPAAKASREDFIRSVEANGAEEAVHRMVPNYFSPKAYTEKPWLITKTTEMIMKQSPAVINDAMRAIMMRTDATPNLATIDVPVLVVNGEEDSMTTKETAADIHAKIPGSKLVVLPEAGHISNMEQMFAFNRVLFEHVAEVRCS